MFDFENKKTPSTPHPKTGVVSGKKPQLNFDSDDEEDDDEEDEEEDEEVDAEDEEVDDEDEEDEEEDEVCCSYLVILSAGGS